MTTITTMAPVPTVTKKISELERVHNNKTRYRLLSVAKYINKILCEQDAENVNGIDYLSKEREIKFEMDILKKLPIDCLLSYDTDKFFNTIKGFENKDFKQLKVKDDRIMEIIEDIATLYNLPIDYLFNEAYEYFGQKPMTETHMWACQREEYVDDYGWDYDRGQNNDQFNKIQKPKIEAIELKNIAKNDFDILHNLNINWEILTMAKKYNNDLLEADKLHDLKTEFLHVDCTDTIQYELDRLKSKAINFGEILGDNYIQEGKIQSFKEFKRQLNRRDHAVMEIIELVATCYNFNLSKFRKVVISYKIPFYYLNN